MAVTAPPPSTMFFLFCCWTPRLGVARSLWHPLSILNAGGDSNYTSDSAGMGALQSGVRFWGTAHHACLRTTAAYFSDRACSNGTGVGARSCESRQYLSMPVALSHVFISLLPFSGEVSGIACQLLSLPWCTHPLQHSQTHEMPSSGERKGQYSLRFITWARALLLACKLPIDD